MSQNVEYIELDQEQAAAWERVGYLTDKLAASRKHEEERKKLKAQIIEAMGECSLAKLPDGTLLTKSLQTRNNAARKASVSEWWELKAAG